MFPELVITSVDSDLRGGIATVTFPERKVLQLRDMPICEGPEGEMVDPVALFKIMATAKSEASSRPLFITVERAITRGQVSKAGITMTGGIGTIHQSYATVRTCALLITPEKVVYAWPSSWKRTMGLTSDKKLSRDLAKDLYPTHASVFSKVKSHGLAEALLLCEWTMKMHLSAKEVDKRRKRT